MKIAIVSDLHLGYERFEEDALRQATEALEEASKIADAILVPGDIFDKRYPRPDVISQAVNIFRDLSRKEWKAEICDYKGKGKLYTSAPIVAIPGTHERIAEGKENAVKLLSLAGMLADTSEATTTLKKGDERVAVFGLGGLSDEMVKERIIALSPTGVEGAFNIFMFHQSIYEMLPFSENIMRYSDLPKGFDLYVCGHMHGATEATVHGKELLIPGSTVLTQLKGEEQPRKGFILYDTRERSHKFIEINSRPFVLRNLSVENANPSELISICEKEIARAVSVHKDKPIIKIKIEGTLAKGFEKGDLQMHSLSGKYSASAFLTVDMSGLQGSDTQVIIDGVRDGKIDDMPIKEMGMLTLAAKLKELGVGNTLNVSELFSILSSESSKEKVLKEAAELLLGGKQQA